MGLTGRLTNFLGVTNKIWTFMALFTLGLLILSTIGASGSNQEVLSEQYSFACPTTSPEDAKEKPTIAVPSTPELSSINFDAQVGVIPSFINQIVPLTDPLTIPSTELSTCLEGSEDVVVVSIEGSTRIYPEKLLGKHAVVNDSLGGTPIAVSYCHTCDSVNVHKAVYRNEILDLSASGQIYKNADLIFDSSHRTFWSAMTGRAVAGPLTGAELESVPFERMDYSSALQKYPESTITSFETGYDINYAIPSFIGFDESIDIIGPVDNVRNELHPKSRVAAFELGGNTYAAPIDTIIQEGSAVIKLDGKLFEVKDVDGVLSLVVDDKKVDTPQLHTIYWYVWADFFPETKLF